MKRNAFGLVAALALAGLAAPSQGATYLNVDCYCNPETEGNTLRWPDGSESYGCPCIQKYTLGKSSTKEFRFRCKSENAKILQQTVRVANLDSPTTCTARVELSSYTTKSCTNWSSLSTDAVLLQVFCIPK